MSILRAFYRLKNKDTKLTKTTKGRGTSINHVGDSLEKYVGSLFNKNEISYLGNPNNPPDLMLKGAEAMEIKKVPNLTSDIALNSSFPKSKLYAHDKMLTVSCIECEEWKEKDFIYVIGCVKNKILKNIWFVYGNCYAADNKIYQRVKDKINTEIKTIPNIEWAETLELGKVKRVDPLGITYLRVRGMWAIQHPQKVFKDFLDDSNAYLILKKEKYNSFPKNERENIKKRCNVKNIKISNPNNPARTIDATLIKMKI